MPLPDPTGGISLAEYHLAITLADSASFRTFARGAANRAAALASIYYKDLPEPPGDQDAYTADQLIALRPFAIIRTAKQGGYGKARIGTNAYVETGKLEIIFEANVPANLANDPAAVERPFENTLGLILDELLALAYTAPDADSEYLAIDSIALEGPARCSEEDVPGQGDFQAAGFAVQWGIGVR